MLIIQSFGFNHIHWIILWSKNSMVGPFSIISHKTLQELGTVSLKWVKWLLRYQNLSWMKRKSLRTKKNRNETVPIETEKWINSAEYMNEKITLQICWQTYSCTSNVLFIVLLMYYVFTGRRTALWCMNYNTMNVCFVFIQMKFTGCPIILCHMGHYPEFGIFLHEKRRILSNIPPETI